MRKGVTAASSFTAPVLRAAEILSSLHPFVVLQDLALQVRLSLVVSLGKLVQRRTDGQ